MQLDRSKTIVGAGSYWNTLHLTSSEALRLIRSLTNQLVAGDANAGREETKLDNGEWFTAFVREENKDRERIVSFIKRRKDEIRHENRDAATILEDLAREIEEEKHKR